jgi:hypothetical protein
MFLWFFNRYSEGDLTKPGKRNSRDSTTPLFEVVSEMEEPLKAATDLTQALLLIGFGLESVGDKDASQPVLAVAEALSEQINTARETWKRALKSATD